MDNISYFDLVVTSIILLLGLKGILNGFFKEFFGLVGIIGGIFIASRLGESVGTKLNNLIFHFENPSAINFTGFIATLAVFWLGMIAVGFIFRKLGALSGLGIYDKILGFFFGASKFFLIAAVIAHAAYNIKAIKKTIDSALPNSIVFPIMVETGSYIMKIDPVQVSQDINTTITKSTQAIKQSVEKSIQENLEKKVSELHKKVEGETH